MDELLRIEGLRVSYYERERTIAAVGGVDMTLARGEILAIVGESGSGKTTLGLSILDLIPSPGRIDGGRIVFGGADILTMRPDDQRRLRGRAISMIFEDPVAGLNPVMEVGTQVEEAIRAHLRVSKKDSRRMVLDALARQGLSDPERIARSYPFNLSGGMCQRVMIAIATVLRPSIIIADEPTSALDVTVQAAILAEIDALRSDLGCGVLLITHDLGVVAQIADRTAVMYAGRIVEQASTLDLYARPRHPYTAALLAARPRIDDGDSELRAIPGYPPDLAELAGTCAFLPRCIKAVVACRTDPWPPLRELAPGHAAACFNPVFHNDNEQ